MYTFLVTVHVIICLALILLVLLQSGRGAELGAAFGSVGQANMARTQMSGIGKVTAVIAFIFMSSSLTLAYMSSQKARESVAQDIAPVAAPVTLPADAPAETAASTAETTVPATTESMPAEPVAPVDATTEAIPVAPAAAADVPATPATEQQP